MEVSLKVVRCLIMMLYFCICFVFFFFFSLSIVVSRSVYVADR